MADPLEIRNGTEGTDLLFRTVLPYNDGYLLRSYTIGEPDANGRAVDTIVCDIHGFGQISTMQRVHSAYDMLHALKRAVHQPRDWPSAGSYRLPHYLTFTPINGGFASYSIIRGGSVSTPGADYLSTQGIISDVVVTIVREPFWRGIAPYTVEDKGPSWSTGFWGYWASAPITMAGDLPSLVSIATRRPASDVYKYVFMSYRSQRMNPRDYNQTMTLEAETWPTMSADTAAQANASASNGSVARCTFTTTAANAMRVSNNVNRRGAYRIFARLWTDAGTTIRCYMQHRHYTGTVKGITFDVLANTPTLYDCGAFQFTKDQGVPDMNFTITPQTFLEFFASRISGGAGVLYIDCFLMMPCDEGFLRFTNTAPALSSSYAYVYDTTMCREQFGATGIWSGNDTFIDPTGPINGVGRMAFQPGAGQIQMLVAYTNYKQDFDLTAVGIPLPAVRAVSCYNTPRGVL